MKLFTARNAAPPMTTMNMIPSMGVGTPQSGYLNFARAYATDNHVASAINLRATSAAEPHIVGRRWRRAKPQVRAEERRIAANRLPIEARNRLLVANGFVEEVNAHPLIHLLNNPNPYSARGQFWAQVVMDYDISGNAFLLKARGPVGNVAELWRLRPDRVKVIPSPTNYIAGYEYRIGQNVLRLEPDDVMHFKTLNPLDEYYGMSPLMQLMQVVNINAYMTGFLKSFFEQGGAGPGAVLATKQKLTQDLRDEIRDRFRKQFGRGGWHELLVLDQNEATYTQMGLNRGLRDALPKELFAEISAAVAERYGIPGSILGILPGYESSSYANKRADWQVFWDITMIPLLSDFSDVLNLSIVPDFGGIDEVVFDLSDIKALQEDVDAVNDRHRKNVSSGIEFWEEGRDGLGLDPNAEGTLLIPSNMIPVRVRAGKIVLPEPEPAQLPPPQDVVAEFYCPKEGTVAGKTCNRWLARNINVGAEAYCPTHKQVLVEPA